MNKVYENKNGVKIEVVEDNYKDSFGKVYVTWRFVGEDIRWCDPKECFKNMIKANGYKEVR